MEGVDQLLSMLRRRLSQPERLLVAFSGGVDSALVAAVASEVLGERAIAVTAVSPSLAREERAAARSFARDRGIAHVEVCTDEFERPEYVRNAGDRCFYCKSALLDAIAPIAAMSGATVALGTNVDDLGGHRPGHLAAVDRGAIAPLLDVGFGKEQVRRVSAALGLSTATKPAAACLSSRIAYGEPVTPELLRRVEIAEQAVRAFGFAVCRVRSHAGGTVARLEVPAADLSRAAALAGELDIAVRAAGFEFCSLDLQGFRSGRMNILLADAGRTGSR